MLQSALRFSFSLLFAGSCSHMRATAYFVESVYNPSGFVSTECDSYLNYISNLCSGRNITLGGNFTIEDSGTYYFQTNAEQPYSEE